VFRGVAESMRGFKKNVAIKRILPALAQNKKFVAMFLDEARLSAQLSHSNCVQVFDIGVGPRLIQLVVKRCDYIFPRLTEGDDPVGATIRQRFRKDADCIIKCVVRDMDRTMIAAETAERTRFLLGMNRIFGAAALGMSCAFAGSQLVATDFLRTVPLGNMKLKTVELRSNDARRPCACSWLIRASASPCEKAEGFDPLRICDGLKVVVIGWPWKYWTITLFKCGSDIAAASA